jgi:5-methylcytosine-specific restriction endonuclease McrA
VCKRSGEEGVVVEREGRLALRLELDHVVPRSAGGNDYVLTNIRTLCRTCNLTRGRMKEAYLLAELRSLAAALSAALRDHTFGAT